MDIITAKNYKYDVKRLSIESDEFKTIKDFVDSCRYEEQHQKLTMQNFSIFKVLENNPAKTLNEKRNNLMLFHGTKEESVSNILKNGFVNSEKGWYGKVD